MEAAKFEVGQDDPIELDLASVDEDLGDLPGGYGQSRIVLLPRDPQWAYAYWDIPNDHKQYLRNQGGQQIALRLYDVTDINLDYQTPTTSKNICVMKWRGNGISPSPLAIAITLSKSVTVAPMAVG